jgi:hypothetical protein
MNAADLVNLTLNFLIQAQKMQALLAQMQLEGRVTLTLDEKAAIRADRDRAFAALDAAIAAAE